MDTVNSQEGTYMYDNVEDSGLRMRKRLSCTVKPPNRGHFGDGPFVHLSLVERLSSSRRFCFKSIRNYLNKKITLEVF